MQRAGKVVISTAVVINRADFVINGVSSGGVEWKTWDVVFVWKYG